MFTFLIGRSASDYDSITNDNQNVYTWMQTPRVLWVTMQDGGVQDTALTYSFCSNSISCSTNGWNRPHNRFATRLNGNSCTADEFVVSGFTQTTVATGIQAEFTISMTPTAFMQCSGTSGLDDSSSNLDYDMTTELQASTPISFVFAIYSSSSPPSGNILEAFAGSSVRDTHPYYFLRNDPNYPRLMTFTMQAPTSAPTVSPTTNPTTVSPTTGTPTMDPTGSPTTAKPTTAFPTTGMPTMFPSANPTTPIPSRSPSTGKPTSAYPSRNPTKEPTTLSPTTSKPTTTYPSMNPTKEPTTASPTTGKPTTTYPSAAPVTQRPTTAFPTRKPTTAFPSRSPVTSKPTSEPGVLSCPSERNNVDCTNVNTMWSFMAPGDARNRKISRKCDRIRGCTSCYSRHPESSYICRSVVNEDGDWMETDLVCESPENPFAMNGPLSCPQMITCPSAENMVTCRSVNTDYPSKFVQRSVCNGASNDKGITSGDCLWYKGICRGLGSSNNYRSAKSLLKSLPGYFDNCPTDI